MDLLEVKSISKTYGAGDTKVEALKDATFSVSKGEFVAIVGESGSGKSTLLNILGGIDTPTSGKVFIDGNDIFNMDNEKLTVFRRRNHLPSQLSGGQQQRVAIGRALITRPDLILADEPTGNLDSKNSSEVITLLKNAAKKYKQTIIMITHSNGIAQAANRIIEVSDGVLTDFGRY